MSIDPLLIIFFVIWFAIAFLLGRLSKQEGKKDRQQIERKLQEEQEAHRAYRQEVTQHFSETAQLFNNMTNSYRDIYEHLSKNALKLCPQDEVVAKLEPLTKKVTAQKEEPSATDVTKEDRRVSA